MSFVRLAPTLLVLLLAGSGIAAMLRVPGRRQGFLEFLGLSYILGFGVVGMASVVLMILGVRIGGFLAPLLGVAGGLALLWRRPRDFLPGEFPRGAVWPAAFIGLSLAAALFGALFRRDLGWDADAFWSLKSKSIARHGTFRNPDFTAEGVRPHARPRYPLLVPAVHAWIYWGVGRTEGGPLRMAMFFFFAASLAVLWALLRDSLPAVPRGWLVAVFALVPAVQTGDSGGAGGWCDYPLAIVLLVAMVEADRWLETGSVTPALMSSLALCFVSQAKEEGGLIVGMAALLLPSLGGLRRGWRGAGGGLAIAAPGLALVVAWMMARGAILPDTVRGWELLKQGIYWARLPDILVLTASHMLRFKEWGLAWVAMAAVLALRMNGIGKKESLLAWFGLGLLVVYVGAWMVVPGESAREVMQDNKKRLLLHAFPLFFTWTCGRLPSLGLVPVAGEPLSVAR